MKTIVDPAIPDYHYRFERLPRQEVAAFERVEACPACGAALDPVEIVRLGGDTEPAFRLVACRQCAHVTYDRLPTDAWLDHYYRDVWDQPNRRTPITTLQVKNSTWTAWAFPWRHLDPLQVPLDAHVLEFGCGFGHGMKYLQQLGYTNVHGVEIGTHRAEVAAHHFPGRVLQGSAAEAEQLADAHGPFDLVVLHHVAEHLRDPYGIIARLAKLLTPTGRVMVSVPNMLHECPVFPALYFPHLQHFNAASMMRLMERAGLTPHLWTGGDAQLTVVGAADPAWRAAADYTPEVPPVTAARLDEIARFLAAPWRAPEPSAVQYLCYFHPWYRESAEPAGFQHVPAAAGRWLTLGRRTVFPLMARLPERRGYGAFLRLGERLFGPGAYGGTEMLALRPGGGPPSATPWLVLPDGGVPVLVK
ncbi:MAG: class I SAM-dependent methyltransferase [Vicinamibacterales bacterium]